VRVDTNAYEMSSPHTVFDVVQVMKTKSLVVATLFVFLAYQSLSAQERSFDPFMAAIKLTERLLEKHHVAKSKLDQDFSERWLENYLATLDPEKLYFLESDIEEFEAAFSNFPEFVKRCNLQVYRSITKRYQQRTIEALDRALARLGQAFDFSINESFYFHHEDWPTDSEHRAQRWRLQLKYDLLLERSNERGTGRPVTFLKSRYASIREQVKELTDEKAFELYLDSFCRTFEPHTRYVGPTEYRGFSGGGLGRPSHSFGLSIDWTGGRAIIRSFGPNFANAPNASKVLGCELLAIRLRNGELQNYRQIFSETIYGWKQEVLKKEDLVTLEMYDVALKRRFSVTWPCKKIPLHRR